jgi:hypothetical protein
LQNNSTFLLAAPDNPLEINPSSLHGHVWQHECGTGSIALLCHLQVTGKQWDLPLQPRPDLELDRRFSG